MANTMRGGARKRREPQRNNSTGLLGISFRWQLRKGDAAQAQICVVVGKHRFTRGVARRSAREAMRQALKLRRDAGLHVPSLDKALAVFESWRRWPE